MKATNDLELKRVLQDLAGQRSDGEPIATLYLDTHWADEKQRERARVFVKEAVKRVVDGHSAHPQRDALARTTARIEAEAMDRISRNGERHGRGLAIFACEAIGLWRSVDLPVAPIENALTSGARARLLPLARLAAGVEPALVAVVHQRGAHIYEVALGDVTAEATIEGPLPRSYLSGGHTPRPALGRMQVPGNERGTAEGFQYERAQKNQRHYEKVAERNRTAAAEFLAQRFDEHPSHVVLVGPREVVAAFERAIPARIQERIIARRPEHGAPGGSPEVRDRLVEEVLRCVADHDRQAEAADIEQAIGQAKRGFGVLGPDDVVLAVNERRVQRLILEDDFDRAGWLCRNCGALGISHADTCAYCAGPIAWVKELGEEMAGRVLADDGEVEIVPHDRRLHSYHGVAAMLRQVTGRGLGVHEQRAPRS